MKISLYTAFSSLVLPVLASIVFAGCSAPGDLLPVTGHSASPAPVAPIEGPIRVACVGDSITYGFGLEDPVGASYPAVLQAILGTGYEVHNFGSNGASAIEVDPTMSYRQRPEYQPSLAFNPHIVVIMLGTNDTRPWAWPGQPEFVEEYTELIRTYQALPARPKIYIGVPPRSFLTVGELSGGLRRTAEAVDAEVIDLYSSVNNYLTDKVHPDMQGHRVMARRVASAIQ